MKMPRINVVETTFDGRKKSTLRNPLSKMFSQKFCEVFRKATFRHVCEVLLVIYTYPSAANCKGGEKN